MACKCSSVLCSLNLFLFYKSWWSVKFIYQLALVEILRRVLQDFLGTCQISQDPAQDPTQDPKRQ